MCHDRYDRGRSEASEPAADRARDDESILDETPRRERPAGDVVRAPVRALRRAKAVLLG